MKITYTKIGIGPLCMLFGKTRHAYYDKSWHQETRLSGERIVLEMVWSLRREMPKLGTGKLYRMLCIPLQNHGIKMGRDALHNLLLEQGMVLRPKRRYIRTTDSNHWMKKYPNLIKNMELLQAEQVWVSDITYIVVANDFNFLSLITDAYSKKIVGYCLYPTLDHKGCLIALQMALAQRSKLTELIHHSDRGTQYCCRDYVGLLQESEIEISMAEKGNPYENAIAERVNGILKNEFDLNQEFNDRQQALEVVDNTIRIYNELRPHMSCNYLTPEQAHSNTGKLEKKWKSKKIFNEKSF
jgi:putative transposase